MSATTALPAPAADGLRDRVADVRGREALGVVRRVGPAMALLLLAFAVYELIGQPADERLWRLMTDLLPAAVIGLVVLGVRRGIVTPARAGWFVVLGSLAVSLGVVVTAVLSAQPLFLAYPLIMALVNGASALDTRQFLVAQSVPVLGTTAVVLGVGGGVDPSLAADWLAVVAVTVAASVAIHVTRSRGFAEMARILYLLEQEAVEDPLTGLGTRRAFDRMAGLMSESAEVAGLSVFVLLLDVDGLTVVNAEGGHAAGDQVLRAVAQALRESARSRDVLVRWGGDEFAVLGMGDPEAATRWSTSVRQRVAALNPVPALWGGTVSLGHATARPGAASATDLAIAADAAMRHPRGRAAATPNRPITPAG